MFRSRLDRTVEAVMRFKVLSTQTIPQFCDLFKFFAFSGRENRPGGGNGRSRALIARSSRESSLCNSWSGGGEVPANPRETCQDRKTAQGKNHPAQLSTQHLLLLPEGFSAWLCGEAKEKIIQFMALQPGQPCSWGGVGAFLVDLLPSVTSLWN